MTILILWLVGVTPYLQIGSLNIFLCQPTMKPILEKDVPKVVQAIRQTTSRKVLSKLMTRIMVYLISFFTKVLFIDPFKRQITEDQAALRQIMRLRGYSLMTNVLEDHIVDIELITLVCAHRFFEGLNCSLKL